MTCRAAARHVVPPRMVQWVAREPGEPKTAAAPGNGTAGRRSRSRGAARTPGRRRRRQPCSEPDTLPSGSDTEEGKGAPGSPTAGVSRGRTGETAVGTPRACHSGDGPASKDRAGRPEGGNRHETPRNRALHPGRGRVVVPGRGGGRAGPRPTTRSKPGAGGARPPPGAAAGGPGPERTAPAHEPAARQGFRGPPRRAGPRPAGSGATGRAAVVRTLARQRAGNALGRTAETAAGRRPPRRAGPRPAGSGATGRAAVVRTLARQRAGNALGRTAEPATARGRPRPGDAPPPGHPGRSPAHRSPPSYRRDRPRAGRRAPPGGAAGTRTPRQERRGA